MMKLVVWGANSYGQLGTGVRSELISEPVYLNSSQLKNLPDLSNIKSISGGGGHTLILCHDGSVYGCGWNNVGQLMADEPVILDFMKLPFLEKYNIIQVASKWDASYAVTADGLCLGWGSNAYSQLGQPAEKFASTREPVTVATNAVQVDCGARHCVILRNDGTVLTAGDAKLGKLGRQTTKPDPNFAEVHGLKKMKSIACGFNHNIALSATGKLYGWGCNKWGQLGMAPQECLWTAVPLELTNKISGSISSIHAGWSSTHVLMKEDYVINFGRNNYGQLGQVRNPDLKDWEPHMLYNLNALSVGSEHALGLNKQGNLVSWGWNEHGSCGVGTEDNLFAPTTVKISSQRILKFAAISGHNYALQQEDDFKNENCN